MADIIWGNGLEVISNNEFILSVTHRKDGNKLNYSDTEKIIITDADLPGLPQNQNEWNKDSLKSCIINTFLKCEIENKIESGSICAKVSHSGVGGY